MLKLTLLKLSMSLAGTYLSLVAPDPYANACAQVETNPRAYLFARYLKTDKEDDTGDFVWKDPQAAAHAGMQLRHYLFAGLEEGFEVRAYWLARTLAYFDYRVGITSAFRDDYRQGLIRHGIKAAVGKSFHGGSRRGGFGNGRAIDLVSLGGSRKEVLKKSATLWAAIDRLGPRFGLGRPYGDRDPPHVAPLSSPEFAVAGHYRRHTLSARRHHHYKHRRVHIARR